MAEAELLSTIAQLAVGLAGFSGIVLVFSRRPGRLSDVEKYRLFMMLGASLGALFLSLLPSVLYVLGLSVPAVWRFASTVMVLFTTSFLSYIITRTRHFYRLVPELFSFYFIVPIIVGHISNALLQLLNAFGIAGTRSAGLYMLGLCWILLHTALQFGRILLVPIPKPRQPVK